MLRVRGQFISNNENAYRPWLITCSKTQEHGVEVPGQGKRALESKHIFTFIKNYKWKVIK